MIRFIFLIIIAICIFWGYNNFKVSDFMNNLQTSIQNEKTIKAVTEKRNFDHEQEEKDINGDMN